MDSCNPTGPAPPDEGDHTAPAHSDRHIEAVVEQIIEAVRRLSPPPGTPPLLTVQGVADRLSVSPRTVEALVADGELKPLRIRSARRFHPDAVDAYVRSLAGRRPRRR